MILFVGYNGSDAPLGDEKGHTSSAPLRGKKGSEYEGGMCVPFIRLVEMTRAMAQQLEAEGALYPIDANGNTLKPIVD